LPLSGTVQNTLLYSITEEEPYALDLIFFKPMIGEEAQASLFRADRKTGTHE